MIVVFFQCSSKFDLGNVKKSLRFKYMCVEERSTAALPLKRRTRKAGEGTVHSLSGDYGRACALQAEFLGSVHRMPNNTGKTSPCHQGLHCKKMAEQQSGQSTH